MQPRVYAIALSAWALSLFLAVAGTNLVIDPMGVFGNKLLPRSLNANERYARLAEFQSQPDRIEGLFFGSSRLQAIPLDVLSRHFAGVTFTNFGVGYGMLTDHLAVLDYVLRQKAAKGQRIKAVFILLDPDSFGRRPYTNESLNFAMPPALSGESLARFWWRNLMAIQFGAWRSDLREVLGMSGLVEPSSARPQAENVLWRVIESASPGVASAQSITQIMPLPADAPIAEKVTDRPLYQQDLELWRRFVTLCRESGIELMIATSPLSRVYGSLFDPSDLSRAIDDVSRLASVWDFTNDDRVSSNPKLWNDYIHFGPEVGRMMLERMFGDPVPPEWEGFGHLKKQRDIAKEKGIASQFGLWESGYPADST
jgi:hypothetical protein